MWDSRMLETLVGGAYNEFGIASWDVDIHSIKVSSERAFSDLLGIPRRMIFFLIERVVSSEAKPLFWSSVVLRSDRFQLRFPTPFHAQPPANARDAEEPPSMRRAVRRQTTPA